MHARIILFTFGLLSGLLGLGLGGVALARAEAPINPSSALLLNQGRSGTTAIESGRYTPRAKVEVRTVPATRKRESGEENSEPVTVIVPTAALEAPQASGAAPVAPQSQQIFIRCEEAPSQNENCPPPPAPAEPVRRLNILELSLAPGYLYNNSESSYTFRNYNSSTPTLTFDANFWLNSEIALHGSVAQTLGGHVNDSIDGSRNAAAAQEWLRIGVHGRKFFSLDSSVSALVFGLDYYDYRFRVPADARLRGGIHSSGVELMLEAEIPASRTRSWTLGVTLAPKLRQTESSTTIDFQSGGSVDANAVGFAFGSRWQFSSNDTIFWKVSHAVEKDLFSGDATLADPRTGSAPTGVSVINSFTIFQIGYTWGN